MNFYLPGSPEYEASIERLDQIMPVDSDIYQSELDAYKKSGFQVYDFSKTIAGILKLSQFSADNNPELPFKIHNEDVARLMRWNRILGNFIKLSLAGSSWRDSPFSQNNTAFYQNVDACISRILSPDALITLPSMVRDMEAAEQGYIGQQIVLEETNAYKQSQLSLAVRPAFAGLMAIYGLETLTN